LDLEVTWLTVVRVFLRAVLRRGTGASTFTGCGWAATGAVGRELASAIEVLTLSTIGLLMRPEVLVVAAGRKTLPIERRTRGSVSVGGSSLPTCQNGTCLVYCLVGNWQV